MLDQNNIISTSISEAVEKISTDRKYYCKYSFMCFTLCSHSIQKANMYSHSIQRADQHIANIEIVLYLPTRMHPV